MSVNNPPGSDEKKFPVVAIVVGICSIALLCIVFRMWFVEAFSFGAPPGQPAPAAIQPVPVVDGIDQALRRAPILQDWANAFLTEIGEGTPTNDEGPQAVWRHYAKWFGILLMGSAVVFLIVKRLFEDTNDESTVMHLKGDTDTALRAKGGRG